MTRAKLKNFTATERWKLIKDRQIKLSEIASIAAGTHPMSEFIGLTIVPEVVIEEYEQERERSTEARRKGGKSAAAQRRDETDRLHAKIRKRYQELLKIGLEPRAVAGRLALEHTLTSRQVRNIVRPKKGK
jgi:hypothetical protein